MYFRFNPKFFIVVFFSIFVFGVMAIRPAQAQTSSDIIIDMVPENPAPEEEISFTLSSYLMDLNTLRITWIENGKTVLSGIGKTYYSTVAKKAGEESTITVRVNYQSTDIENKVVIHPSSMVMLWQALDSYTPPFYKGKALPVADSKIRVVALPEIKSAGSFISPTNLSYYWRRDYSNDVQASGYAKNYFDYIADYLDPSSYIEVTANNTSQTLSASSAMNIGTYKPKIVFYSYDPDEGIIFEQALADGYKINEKGILMAVPYFISPENLMNPRLSWTWYINNSATASTGYQKYLLPVQVRSGVSGKSNIKLEVENLDRVFQTDKSEINVEF